jgi:hypothetical protein
MGFNTYDHTISQTVSSSNSLDSYYCRKTQHTVTFYPNSFVLQSISSQHMLQNLINFLGLTIVLSMIYKTKTQLGIQGFMQPLPELQSKLSSSIRHNLLRHNMQTNYPWHIQFCQLRSRVGHLDRYKVSYLGPSIQNYLNRIVVWLISWQTHDKIHVNFFALPLRHLQRLQ